MGLNAKYIQSADTVDYTPTSAVAAGSVVIQSGLVGVANLDIPANTLGALAVSGQFDLKKTTVAIDAGAKVYWNTTSGYATTTSAGGVYVGIAAENVTSAGATVRVLLNK